MRTKTLILRLLDAADEMDSERRLTGHKGTIGWNKRVRQANAMREAATFIASKTYQHPGKP